MHFVYLGNFYTHVDIDSFRPFMNPTYKLVKICPQFIFYSAFDRKQIAKLYSAIWEAKGT